MERNRIGFGGGCHWCTEAVFQSLIGVGEVRQGFIASDPPDDGWSEAVEVLYDPGLISLEDLVLVHLATHASTADHKLRGKYRSAIYTQDPGQTQAAGAALVGAGAEGDMRFVTRVLPHRGFRASQARFHNYYASDPERPFCRTYIDPKLARLRSRFTALMKAGAG